MILRTKLDVDAKYFYWAEVYKDKKALELAAKALLKKCSPVRKLGVPPIAVCINYTLTEAKYDAARGLWRPYKETGCLGTVMFNKNNLGADILAHEFTHAALRWARTKGFEVAGDKKKVAAQEEKFCHVVGWLVIQMQNALVQHAGGPSDKLIDECYGILGWNPR
jgi:hypothetical protein